MQLLRSVYHPQRILSAVTQMFVHVNWHRAPELGKDAADLLEHVALRIERPPIFVPGIIAMFANQNHTIQVESLRRGVFSVGTLVEGLPNGWEDLHTVLSRQRHANISNVPACLGGQSAARQSLPVHTVEGRQVNLIDVHRNDVDHG